VATVPPLFVVTAGAYTVGGRVHTAEKTQKSTVRFSTNHHVEKNKRYEVRGFERDEKTQRGPRNNSEKRQRQDTITVGDAN
jgi:hypothetical protein